MHVRMASIAERDIADCALWLDQQQTGLGDDFVAAVERAFTDILQMPSACPTLHIAGLSTEVELRWHAAGRFSHKVVFQVSRDEVLVIGVLHPRRDLEAVLRSRLGSR